MLRTLHVEKLLDPIGWQILQQLQENARISHSELGRRVGLSTPAVAERVRRMEEAGIITGYHASVDPTKAGFPIVVYMRLAVSGGENMVSRATAALKAMPELLECHRITGTESFVMRVGLHSVAHLETLIDRLTPFGMTSTSTVLSSPVPFRPLQPTPSRELQSGPPGKSK
ncbi:MAG TPA: Lrp/AsnC family transcriptional regulator [Candidatus Saccharimonadales bacterium]|nr:Lrp/AsnC family transcriptional regulator [Candidatus Saccharimonadales bacterium]